MPSYECSLFMLVKVKYVKFSMARGPKKRSYSHLLFYRSIITTSVMIPN